MNTFTGLSGVITAASGLAVVVKSIQADVPDASVTDVGITVSGGTVNQHVNGITPVVMDLRFAQNQSVTVSSSGTLNGTIINYIFAGRPIGHAFQTQALSKAKEVISSGYYSSPSKTTKWGTAVLSGSYQTGFGG